jgi:hypothetical protein
LDPGSGVGDDARCLLWRESSLGDEIKDRVALKEQDDFVVLKRPYKI